MTDPGGSTTSSWKWVKVRRPAGGKAQPSPKGTTFRSLGRWPRDRKVRLTVLYRGGAEGWFLIEARSRHGVFPGWMALEDVMATVYSERR